MGGSVSHAGIEDSFMPEQKNGIRYKIEGAAKQK